MKREALIYHVSLIWLVVLAVGCVALVTLI